jgi:hypothetical protein
MKTIVIAVLSQLGSSSRVIMDALTFTAASDTNMRTCNSNCLGTGGKLAQKDAGGLVALE